MWHESCRIVTHHQRRLPPNPLQNGPLCLQCSPIKKLELDMTQYQSDEKARLKRRWVEQAIALAMQNRWQDAVHDQPQHPDLFPNDVDALNRLGRALTELGQYGDARQAYASRRDRRNNVSPGRTSSASPRSACPPLP